MIDFDKYSDNVAIITSDNKTFTYGELSSVISLFSPFMKHRGLCFIMCTNTVASLIGYLACLENRYVAALLDDSKDEETIDNLVGLYKPEYMWITNEKVNEKKDWTPVFCFEGYTLLRTSYEHGENQNCDIYDELAICLTTSGSTGSPKFVRLSYQNLISNAESIAIYLGIDEKERPITTLPMHYSYGLSVINSHLIKGATLLLTNLSVAQRAFWDFFRQQQATSMSGVPYTYELLRRLRFSRMSLPSLKTMTQAGGKLNPELVKEYLTFAQETNRRFFVMYGQTEATARMSYLPIEVAMEKYKSIGVAIPFGEFHLEDANGMNINQDEIDGELVYTGPNVSLGYAESREDLDKGDENHGILHTGDIAKRDKDGFYYITGRISRFVKVWGNRCNLDALEQLAKTFDPDAVCVGEDDHIVLVTINEVDDNNLVKFLSHKTGLNPVAFKIKHIPSIPKNSSGKVLYSELKKMVL